MTGFTISQNSTMQRYNETSGNGLLATADFSATASEFKLDQIGSKLFTFVKISPADFSDKPTLSIHITNIKMKLNSTYNY